jgi:hypothetical protein
MIKILTSLAAAIPSDVLQPPRGDTGLLQRRPVTANLKTLWLNWSYS